MAATYRTSATRVNCLVISLCTEQANFICRTRSIFFNAFFSFRYLSNVFQGIDRFIVLVYRIRSRRKRAFMFPCDTFLVSTTATREFQFFKAGFGKGPIGFIGWFVFLPRSCRIHRRFITGSRGIIDGYRGIFLKLLKTTGVIGYLLGGWCSLGVVMVYATNC